MKKMLVFICAVVIGASTLAMASYATVQDGELVKGSDKAVYLIKNGKRHAFPNEKVFKSYGFSFENVKKLSDSALNATEFGGFLFGKSELFKLPNSEKVYMLVNGALRHLENPTAAEKHAGADWGSRIRMITETQFGAFTVGEILAESMEKVVTQDVEAGEIVLPGETPVTEPQDSPAADLDSINVTPVDTTTPPASENASEILDGIEYLKPTGTGKWRFEHQVSFKQSTNCSDKNSWLDPVVGSIDSNYQDGWEKGFLAGQERRDYIEAGTWPPKAYDDTVSSGCTGECATGYQNGYRKGYDYYTASIQSFYKRCREAVDPSLFDNDGWLISSKGKINAGFSERNLDTTLSYGIATPLLESKSVSGDTQQAMGMASYTNRNADTNQGGITESSFMMIINNDQINKNSYNKENPATNVNRIYFDHLTGATMEQGMDAFLSAHQQVKTSSVTYANCEIKDRRTEVPGVTTSNTHQEILVMCPTSGGITFLVYDYFWMNNASAVAIFDVVRAKKSYEGLTVDAVNEGVPNYEFMAQLMNKVTW